LPVFKDLYQRVKDGSETRRVIEACGAEDYQKSLGAELAELGNSEMWRAGKATRDLRPKEQAREVSAETKGVGGRDSN
jgi:ketol-acid reductoisomerase